MKALIRKLTAWAWRPEIAAAEGIATLTELHATPGAMELHIKSHPGMHKAITLSLAEMVRVAPNYTEMKFDLFDRSQFEWITVLVQKGKGKTPHELRRIAEQERDELRRVLDKETTR